MENTAELKEKYLEIIRKNTLFEGIDTPALAQIIRSPYLRLEKYDAGSILGEQGRIEDSMLLVLDGCVRAFRTDYW